MKNIVYLLVFKLLLISCNTETKVEETVKEDLSESMQAVTNEVLSPADFKEKMNNTEDFYLIDVRTPEELEETGIIEGTININIYNENFNTELANLDQSKTVFVYCRSGQRSAQSALVLEELGFKEIYDLAGGITAWKTKKE